MNQVSDSDTFVACNNIFLCAKTIFLRMTTLPLFVSQILMLAKVTINKKLSRYKRKKEERITFTKIIVTMRFINRGIIYITCQKTKRT